MLVNDALDAILLGSFLFGLLFAAASLLLGVADHGHDAGDAGPGGHALGLLNVGAILAFVAWFGGVGYLVRHGLGWSPLPSVVVGLVAGAAVAVIVTWFLVKIVRPAGRPLDPADYHLPGTLATVTSPIRASGVGEIIYEQGGVRQVSAARAAPGVAIGRGTEVVVLEWARGVALVAPWEALVAERREAGVLSDGPRAT